MTGPHLCWDLVPKHWSGHHVVMVVRIQGPAELELFEVAEASGGLGLGFGLTQRGQKHRRQNRNDGDDDEEFDESERALRSTARFWSAEAERSGVAALACAKRVDQEAPFVLAGSQSGDFADSVTAVQNAGAQFGRRRRNAPRDSWAAFSISYVLAGWERFHLRAD